MNWLINREIWHDSQVGHALHWQNPVFKKYTFSEKVKDIAFQLEMNEPAVCQSMYIYKNPGIGSEGKKSTLADR